MAAPLTQGAIGATLYLQSVFAVFPGTVLTVADSGGKQGVQCVTWRSATAPQLHLGGFLEFQKKNSDLSPYDCSLPAAFALLQAKGLSGRDERIMGLPTLTSSLYHISLLFDQLYAFSQNNYQKNQQQRWPHRMCKSS